MLKGEVNRVMIVGKGSLFLGRMTNLFDGVSFLVEKNDGPKAAEAAVSSEEIRQIIAESLRDFAQGLLESR
jgi:betaine reductase